VTKVKEVNSRAMMEFAMILKKEIVVFPRPSRIPLEDVKPPDLRS
jgi:hypothetical protein